MLRFFVTVYRHITRHKGKSSQQFLLDMAKRRCYTFDFNRPDWNGQSPAVRGGQGRMRREGGGGGSSPTSIRPSLGQSWPGPNRTISRRNSKLCRLSPPPPPFTTLQHGPPRDPLLRSPPFPLPPPPVPSPSTDYHPGHLT